MIGKLIDNPTLHEMARAFFACAVPGSSVRFIENGLRVEGHGQYFSMTDEGMEMEIANARIGDIDMTVAEFCKLLIGVVEAGGMESYWSGKIRVSFHIRGWADIPID